MTDRNGCWCTGEPIFRLKLTTVFVLIDIRKLSHKLYVLWVTHHENCGRVTVALAVPVEIFAVLTSVVRIAHFLPRFPNMIPFGPTIPLPYYLIQWSKKTGSIIQHDWTRSQERTFQESSCKARKVVYQPVSHLLPLHDPSIVFHDTQGTIWTGRKAYSEPYWLDVHCLVQSAPFRPTAHRKH